MNSDFQLTNRLKKEFASLDDSKGRRRARLFVAEGSKCVLELSALFRARYIFAKKDWIENNIGVVADELIESAPRTLRELTRLNTTPPVIAFFELPEPASVPDASYFANNIVLALDRVQDPGNLGTILRTCDWFGVHTVVASKDSADAFNPKAVQATMGALARTKVVYTDLADFIKSLPGSVPVFGTFLDGKNIYTEQTEKNGVIVMGNEGNGISEEVAKQIGRRLYIPPFIESDVVESLNVATATAIVLSEFRAKFYRQ